MIRNSEKRVKMAIWLLFVVFFIVYMSNADRVYHALSGKSYISKVSDNFQLHAKGDLQMQAIFDYSPVNNKFGEGKGLRGQFNTVANKSGNAKVRIFFRSSDALYEVIENRRSFWAYSMKIAMNFFATTSGLENGIYQIGICLSDDEGKRFVWMDSFFEKITGGPVEYFARPIASVPAMVSKDIMFRIEKYDQNDKEIIVQGWVVLDDAEMSNYNAYIMIKDFDDVVKTFYVPLYTRMDIATKYKDPRAANSGFRINILLRELASDNYTISVVLKSRKTGEAIKSKEVKCPLASISAVAKISQLIRESRNIKTFIDVNQKIGKYQKITGWAYVENQETKGQKVYVQFENPDGTMVHYSTMPMERLDVGTTFKNPLYNTCGFSALIPLKDGFDINDYTIRFVVKNKNGTYKSLIRKAGIKFNSRARISAPKIESQTIKFSVDTSEDRGKGVSAYRYLSGWVYIADQQTLSQEVYVQLEESDGTMVHYSTIPMERPDVGDYFKNPLYNASGFSALIPLKDGFDIDDCTIRFVIKNRNGTYKSHIWKAGKG